MQTPSGGDGRGTGADRAQWSGAAPRYDWRRLDRDDEDQVSYTAIIATALAKRQR